MKKVTFFMLFFCFSLSSISQNDWLAYPGNSDTLLKIQDSLDYTQSSGKVTVYADDRIAKIEDFVRSGEESLEGVKIDGYRVLIFFDMSKSAAEQQKAHVISLYPEHKTYVDYSAPNYRVRAGNFRTQLEAEKLKQEILVMFPTAIVVPDKIQLPELPVIEN